MFCLHRVVDCSCEGSMHQFSRRAGRNIVLRNSDCVAVRSSGYDGGLVVTAEPLRTDELLQVLLAFACHYFSSVYYCSCVWVLFNWSYSDFIHVSPSLSEREPVKQPHVGPGHPISPFSSLVHSLPHLLLLFNFSLFPFLIRFIMVALCNRADHYIFILFLSSLWSPYIFRL